MISLGKIKERCQKSGGYIGYEKILIIEIERLVKGLAEIACEAWDETAANKAHQILEEYDGK